MVRLKRSSINTSCFIIILAMLLLALLSLPALADQGDGSGGGQGEPLRLDSSSPYNGQSGVPTDVLITMTFSKNVVNMTVSGNNLNCFSLCAADGSVVPVEVLMADDQIEPEKKRIINLEPLQELKQNTAYTVKVSSALQSKSGVTLGSDLTITFITAKEKTAAGSPVINTPAPQNTGGSLPAGTVETQAAQAVQGDNNAAGNAGAAAPGSGPPASASVNTAAGSGADKPAGAGGGQGDTGKSAGQGAGPAAWILAVAALALIAAGYFITRRKK